MILPSLPPSTLDVHVCIFINTIGQSYYKLFLNKNSNVAYQLFMIHSLIVFRFTAFPSISKRIREKQVEQLISQLSSSGKWGMFQLHSLIREVYLSCVTLLAAFSKNANNVLRHLCTSLATSKSFKSMLMKVIFKCHSLTNTAGIQGTCVPLQNAFRKSTFLYKIK